MQKPHRYAALDTWRGICALLVTLYHFNTASWIHHNLLVARGWLFVDFFFVLSGFVIAFAYEDKLSAGGYRVEFLVRRIARLWPLHAAVLAGCVLLEGAREVILHDGFESGHAIADLPGQLLLLNGLGIYNELSWNWPSWSVSVELFLYIIFSLFTFSARSLRTPIAVTAVIASLLFIATVKGTMAVTYDFGLVRGVAGFSMGYLVQQYARLLPPTGTVMEVFAVALAIIFAIFAPPVLTVLAPLIFGVVVAVFACEGGFVSRILRSSLGRVLGTLSFSIYLIHSLIIVAMKGALSVVKVPHLDVGPTGGPLFVSDLPLALDAVTLGFILVTVITAVATHRLVEIPPQRWARSWFKCE